MIAARTVRQRALFERADPPQVHAVLDEAVLRRRVGGEDVIRGQLLALADLAARPKVRI